jgi:hypothetical protein
MPTILITYANDAKAPLRVTMESNAVQTILADMPDKGFEIRTLSEVSTAGLVEFLTSNDQGLEVLHYCGHANSNALAFSGNSADAQRLAERLRFCKNLKLVFLNGCQTKGQVRFFHEAGVPYILATSAKVKDDEAIWFAEQFYKYLARGHDVEEAFEKARADGRVDGKAINLSVKRDVSGMSDMFDEDDEEEGADFDWGLYVKEGALEYKLPMEKKTSAPVVNKTVIQNAKKIYNFERTDNANFH